MNKAITSKDPRKESIVRALKYISGCEKITEVKQIDDNDYVGTCHKYVGNKKYDRKGIFKVTVTAWKVEL